ncbi:LytR C-terminal domain-containing protein [Sanguibacter inulinus]|uniref:LytR C-terminal domain-containing protein n=1 Tax=Sanguibacter inulinus TaxID=60922 RepID=A0A853EV29_9MICO|nr:LytR C-terminal domain-containing protein [Sanguibacter inulinus]MBF0723145.1 LytR C-terminal domain-containing protein [Sanguibacter inulinus]NYS94290.1 LytR C-terminal domain-containing protein [Sanguibacter inulinus]
MSKYPEDEFDRTDGLGLPAGVHRTPRSAWSKTAPFLVVVVLCAALAVAAVYVLSRTPGSPLDQSSASPSASAPAEDPAAEDPAAEDPAAEDPAAEDPAADPETPAEPEVPVADTSVAVRVLNATGRSGAAAGAADTLSGAGWSDVSADNYTGDRLNASVVWYQSEDLADEAQAVADLLGIPASQVTLVPELRGPLSVILAG